MAQDKLLGIVFALLLFVLFSSLMTYAIFEMGENYGVSSDDVSGGALTSGSFTGNITEVETKAENYRARFEAGNPIDVDDATGIFSVVTDMVSLIITPFTLLATIFINVLGIPSIAVSIILGLLSITILFSIWRFIKQGD